MKKTSALVCLLLSLLFAADAEASPLRLRVSANKRFLEQSDGTPFFWKGDTCWGMSILTAKDRDIVLDNEVEQGFNAVWVDITNYGFKPIGLNPFINDDTDKPNETYWATIDSLLTAAEQRGIYVGMVIAWPYHLPYVNNTLDRIDTFGAYLGRRYRDRNNVVWVISGEYSAAFGYCAGCISPNEKAKFDHMAAALTNAGATQLKTIHPGGHSWVPDFQNSTWLDFSLYQTSQAANPAVQGYFAMRTAITEGYSVLPTRPTMNGEPGYEGFPEDYQISGIKGGPVTGNPIRRDVYWSLFLGAFGYVYGSMALEDIHQKSPSDPYWWAPYDDFPLRDLIPQWNDDASLHAEGRNQMRFVNRLIESRPITGRIPDQSIILSPVGTAGISFQTATRGSDRSYAWVYIPDGAPITIDMSKLAGVAVKSSWYSPRDGSYALIGQYPNAGSQTFDPPGATADGNDWVLVLDAVLSTMGSGTISATSPCTVAVGDVTCSTMVTWNTQGVAGAQVWVENTGAGGTPAVIATGLSGSISFPGIAVPPNRYAFTLYSLDGNARIALSSVVVTAVSQAASSFTLSPSSLTFSYQRGSELSTQFAAITSNLPNAPFTFVVSTVSGGNWISAVQNQSATPATVTVLVNPAGLLAGAYTGSIRIFPPGQPGSASVLVVTLNVNSLATYVIPQVVDGASWSSTVILANLDSQPASFLIRFRQADGSPMQVDLKGSGRVTELSDTIPVGGSRTIETTGFAAGLSEGWAELTSLYWIGGTAVFRQRGANSDVEAAVSIGTPISQHFLLPFDNSGGSATGMAVLNSDALRTVTSSVQLRDQDGHVLNRRSFSLAARTRETFMLPSQFPETAGVRGVAEFSYQPSELSVLGLRFTDHAAFTSFGAVSASPQFSDNLTLAIPQIADGANWKTTLVLVNRGSSPAPFSLVFWKRDGTPLALPLQGLGSFTQYSDSIPVGGMRIIETPGTANELLDGWAEMSATSIAGTAIFRYRGATGDSEAGVPINAAVGTRFVVPFDNTLGFATGLAVANLMLPDSQAVTAVYRDEDGGTILSESIPLDAHGRQAFMLPASLGNRKGTVELSGAGISVIGLRFNPLGSMASIQALQK